MCKACSMNVDIEYTKADYTLTDMIEAYRAGWHRRFSLTKPLNDDDIEAWVKAHVQQQIDDAIVEFHGGE